VLVSPTGAYDMATDAPETGRHQLSKGEMQNISSGKIPNQSSGENVPNKKKSTHLIAAVGIVQCIRSQLGGSTMYYIIRSLEVKDSPNLLE